MQRFGFLLLDGYPLMSTAAAMEPLRAANMFAGETLYDCRILSLRAPEARSSVGSQFDAVPIRDAGTDFDVVFVVAGGDPLRIKDPELFTWLRRLDRAGVALGGISGGAAILARAGVMDNRRFAIHWHHLDDLRAVSDQFLIEKRLYVIDRDRYTCAGGTAPLDMMHSIVAMAHGTTFAQRISDWFIQTDVRGADAPQQTSIAARYGPLPRAVQSALELMESHVADPLDLDQIAALAGLSRRQLQRQFAATLGQTMSQIYRRIRLDTARGLIQSSDLKIGEIADMTGFPSQAHFADSYRRVFGAPPSAHRPQGRD